MDPSRGDSRYNLNYSMSGIGLSLADQADIYGNPTAAAALSGRPPSGGLIQTMGSGGSIGLVGRSSAGTLMTNTQCQSLSAAATNSNVPGHPQHSRGVKRTSSDCYDDHPRGGSSGVITSQMQGLDTCTGSGNGQQQQASTSVSDVVDDNYSPMQNKKSPPANGKKTKGRVKIKMEYIDNKLRRYTTFSKRKTGIMKKAYELSTLTGTQVMLLVASETGHVYTFATRKLQPMITSEAGKQLIQTCLNSPDPPSVGGGDQRMSATGFEETELSYNIADEDSKDNNSPLSSGNETDDSSDPDSPGTSVIRKQKQTAPNTKRLGLISVKGEPTTEVPSSTLIASPCLKPQSENISKVASFSNQIKIENKEKPPPEPDVVKSCELRNLQQRPYSQRNVIYPISALSTVPQEVLLQLIQAGHLQLHTEEDGSGHQYITIPLSVRNNNGNAFTIDT